MKRLLERGGGGMEHNSYGNTREGRVRSRRSVVAAFVTTGALGFLLVAAGAGADASDGTLALNATFTGTFKGGYCPPVAPVLPSTECYAMQGAAAVSGLGRTAMTGTFFLSFPYGDLNSCRLVSVPDGVLLVAGKGEIDFSARNDSCQPGSHGGSVAFSDPYTVTGGSGTYAGATGSGTLQLVMSFDQQAHKSTFTGPLTVPGLVFDTTPPTMTSGGNKLVLVKKPAHGARVRYTATATDEVDGRVPVTCTPRSGSRFRLGRTRVRCASTDSSANTAGSNFTITVKNR